MHVMSTHKQFVWQIRKLENMREKGDNFYNKL